VQVANECALLSDQGNETCGIAAGHAGFAREPLDHGRKAIVASSG
jgi:hypothetical protein